MARPTGATLLPEDRAELWATTRKLLRIGIPIGMQVLTEVGVFSVVSLLAGRLGARTSSAHQIALGLSSLAYMGVLGMSAATAVRVGRAVGAREEGGPRRAGVVGLGLASLYMASTSLVFLLCAGPLARLFTPDAAVVASAVTLVHIAAAFQIADGLQGVAGGALRGAADTRFASWANVACHWGIGLPLAIVLAFVLGWGATGLWWGLTAGLVVVAGVLVRRFVLISGRHIAAA
jgi:multidrug resistance protein, MATE family